MTRVGVTGHRDLPEPTCKLVSAAIAIHLARFDSIDGISSLAEGADQIFAEQVLMAGGALTAVVPSAHYGRSFATTNGSAAYRRLRALAREVIELPFSSPSEEAYWAAGQRLVGLAEELLAVWDGTPSQGVGGTADVVALARERGVPTTIVWPPGSRRDHPARAR
ncbi:MAG: hypothetical protein V7607_3011 [Solirubrobacteraceae bacterium]